MKAKKDDKSLAQKLNTCMDQPPAESDAAEAAIVEALRLSAARIEPAPDFVTGLSIRLRHQRQTRDLAARRSTVHRLLWAGAAAILVASLTLVLPHLLGSRGLPPLPRLAYAAGSGPAPTGLLAGATLTLSAPLPTAPKKMPIYVAAAAPVPATSEEAIAWALKFGISNPKVYRNPGESRSIYVLGDDGQQLIFRRFGPMGSIDYSNDYAVADAQGPSLTFEQASQAAVTFLRERGLLPDHYRTEEAEAPGGDSPTRAIRIVPVLDDYPLVGNHAGAYVLVNPAGQVVYASLNPLTFKRGQGYPIRSAEDAYGSLSRSEEIGSPFRLDVDLTMPTTDIRHYRPEPPAYTPGQSVTATGWIHVLVAEGGNEIRARLTARDGTLYDLTGPRVAELAAPESGFGDVRARGIIVARTGPNRWQMEVTDWNFIPASNVQPPACQVGTFAEEGTTAWLVTDTEERYRLPDAPEALVDGERIEVCADEWPAGGEPVNWWGISSPPASEQRPVPVASSSTIVVVEAIETPQVEAPFEIGQRIELTGAVYATLYVNGDARRVEAYLDKDEADEEPPYSLAGPTELLEEIAQHNRLHVRVWGRVVPAQDSPNGQAIQVERFERLWPQERLQGFPGHVDLERLEGREVAVFTDHETGQRYVLDQSLEGYWTSSQDPLMDVEQAFVSGVVHPEKTYAGLPVLRLVSSQAGQETVAATSADQFPVDTGPQVVDEAALLPAALQGTFIIDRVELAYYCEPQPAQLIYAQPVWVFYGHSPDGATHFTAYVQAVAEEYIESAGATTAPIGQGE